MSFSPEQNNAICLEFFKSAWNEGNVREDLLTPDAIDHSQVGGKQKSEPGSGSFKQIIGMFRHAMPDIKLTLEDEIYTTVVRMKDGKIAERWANVDELGLLQQLGVVPPPPAPPAE